MSVAMESKFHYKIGADDHSGIIIPDENCAFGFMGQGSGNPTYFFGAYEEGARAHFSAIKAGDVWDDWHEANNHVTTNAFRGDVSGFLDNCKNYIVNVEHKLTSAKYDDMKQGILNWIDAKQPELWFSFISQGGNYLPSFGSTGLDIINMSGTTKLSEVGALYGFNNIGEVVKNIFITAYYYDVVGTPSYGDTQYEFITYDTLRKAIDDEYITDPDIIDFFNENEWEEIFETRCDWTINLDGSKNPDVTIMWNCPMIEEGGVDSGSATVSFELLTYNTLNPLVSEFKTMGTYSYQKHVLKTTWAKLAQEANYPGFAKILSNVLSLVGVDTILKIRMYVTYFMEGGQSFTSTAEAHITYTGTGTGSILPPKDGSTISFTHTSTDEAIELFLDDIDLDDLDDPTVTDPTLDQAFSGVGLLTKTYVLTKSRLQQLGRFLWTRDFFDYIEDLNASPIENIVSVKMVPFDIPCGSDTTIVLGNVNTGVYGKPVDIDYNCKHTIGTVTIQKKYPANCNFLNSNTFTKLTLFLPFIGFKEIDADLFLDKTLKVEYINDIITGNCKAVIYADNIPICDFSGQIGLDVPISSTNRAQVEMGLISAVGQGIAQVASGNIGGAVSSALSIGSNSFHTETRGANSPSVDSFMTHDCFYILENAVVQYPSRYNHTHGRPLNLSKTLRNVTGFTVCEEVDVSGIQGATKEELDYIKDMLEKGVYL